MHYFHKSYNTIILIHRPYCLIAYPGCKKMLCAYSIYAINQSNLLLNGRNGFTRLYAINRYMLLSDMPLSDTHCTVVSHYYELFNNHTLY
jgi:hypothetical protein